MAKPDLDDGFFQLAHELDAALDVADFTKGARIVLREVKAQIFFPAFRKTAALSPSDIAARYGQLRPHIARAVKELTDAGVLVREDDGTYRFIKDYESWTRNGRPRLTETEVSACRHAPIVARSHTSPGAPASPPPKRNNPGNASKIERNSLGTESVPESLRERNSLGTESVPESLRFEGSPHTPLVGREREETRELESAEGASEPGTSDLDSLFRWADDLGYSPDLMSYGEFARAQAKAANTPPWWIWTILVRKVWNQQRPARVALLIQMMNGFRLAGEAEWGPTPKPWGAPAPAGAPPTIPMQAAPPRRKSPGEERRDLIHAKIAARRAGKEADHAE